MSLRWLNGQVPPEYGPQKSTNSTNQTQAVTPNDCGHTQASPQRLVNGTWNPIPESIDCDLCDVRTESLDAYYRHISSLTHQRNSFLLPHNEKSFFANKSIQLPEFLLWDHEANERSMVVTGIKIANTSNALLLHFVKYGYVTDFIFDTHGSFAIIQYDDKSSLDRMLDDKGNKCNGGFVRVRNKSMISFVEWSILLDLDGTHEKLDQPFFINHWDLMLSLKNTPIQIQLIRFLENTGIKNKMFDLRKKVFGDMHTLLSQIFPNMIFKHCQPQAQALLEVDHVLQVFLDPLGESEGKAMKLRNKSNYHHSIPYQAAINKAQLMLMSIDNLYEMEKIAAQITMSSEEKFFNYGDNVDGIAFTHLSSGMKCRVNFNDPFAPLIGSLLDLMVEIDPLVGPLLRFLTYWGRTCRLTLDDFNMNTILSMMLISFLMEKNLLPSVKALQELHVSTTHSFYAEEYLRGWKISICKHLPTIEDYMKYKGKSVYYHEKSTPASTEELLSEDTIELVRQTRRMFIILRDFFNEFAWMDLNEKIISPHIGSIISKFCYIREYTPETLDFKKRPKWHRIAKGNGFLNVQHPFDISQNLAKDLDENVVSSMQNEFRQASKRISEELAVENPDLNNMFSNFTTMMRWEPYPNFRYL